MGNTYPEDYDIYDILAIQHVEIQKIREQILKGKATLQDSYRLQAKFQEELNRIMSENAKFSF